MKVGDTSLGGPHNRFPDTTQGFIVKLRGPSGTQLRAGMEEVCRRYWKPIYAYLRIALAKTNEDAKDLTQAFLLWLLEDAALRRFDPEKGGFRPYLKLLLNRFVLQHDRALKRLKRGGGLHVFSLDDDPGLADLVAGSRIADPESLFDQIWVYEVMRRAIDRVKARCASEGRATAFRVYEEYDLATREDRPTYAELATLLGLDETQVKSHLFSVREGVRAEIRNELAQLTAGDRELEEEWRDVFGG